jgi:hypothetical protein
MKTFNRICQQIELLQPRKLHLEAFANGINGNEKAMKSCIAACITKARQLNATYDLDWAENDQQIWSSGDFQHAQSKFWQNRWGQDMREEEILEEEDEIVETVVNILFTLPLPDWFLQQSLQHQKDLLF